jgi:hypothetical protein
LAIKDLCCCSGRNIRPHFPFKCFPSTPTG